MNEDLTRTDHSTRNIAIIYYTNLCGDLVVFELPSEIVSAKEIANEIQVREGISSDQQRLSYKGKKLSEIDFVSLLSTHKELDISLSMRIRGGSPIKVVFSTV